MKNLISTVKGNKIICIERTKISVWRKLREIFETGFMVDEHYNKIRVTTSRKEIIDFFENPHKINRRRYYTEIIL